MNDEQAEELEALESIYSDVFLRNSENSFDIIVRGLKQAIKLSFIFTEEYPAEAPFFNLQPMFDTGYSFQEELHGMINEVIERGLGSAMMFDIIERVREWLDDNIPEEEKAVEEQEIKKTYETYTTVTVESFNKWKIEFDEEHRRQKQALNEMIKNQVYINGLTYLEVWNKPSGKEYFERNDTQEEEPEEEKTDN